MDPDAAFSAFVNELTLHFGRHHTKVICNTLHCMMGLFLITAVYSLNILPSAKKALQRIWCYNCILEISVQVWEIKYILWLCTIMFTTCILDIFTVYKYTIKIFIYYYCLFLFIKSQSFLHTYLNLSEIELILMDESNRTITVIVLPAVLS